MRNTRNLYYYIMSFISLAILYWAVADLLRLVLEQILTQPIEILNIGRTTVIGPDIMPPYPRPVPNTNAFLVRYIAILLALPTFVFHWFKTSGGILENRLDEASFEEISVRRIYCQIVLALGAGFFLISIILFLSEIIQKGGYGYFQSLSTPLAMGLISTVVVIYHLVVLIDCNNRLDRLPQTKPSGLEAKFCPFCGKGLKKDWTFCAGCGNKASA